MVLRSKQMTAKEYLNQIRLLDLKIRQKIEERDHLKAMAAGNSSPVLSKDKVQTSGSGDKMSRTVDSYVDLEKEIDDLVDRYVDKRDMIINQIHQLNNPRYIRILYLRYVKCCTFEYIAVEMNYTIRGVYKLHGNALQAFQKLILNHD